MTDKIRFRDLSLPLKVLVWLAWVYLGLIFVITIYSIGYSAAEFWYMTP